MHNNSREKDAHTEVGDAGALVLDLGRDAQDGRDAVERGWDDFVVEDLHREGGHARTPRPAAVEPRRERGRRRHWLVPRRSRRRRRRRQLVPATARRRHLRRRSTTPRTLFRAILLLHWARVSAREEEDSGGERARGNGHRPPNRNRDRERFAARLPAPPRLAFSGKQTEVREERRVRK